MGLIEKLQQCMEFIATKYFLIWYLSTAIFFIVLLYSQLFSPKKVFISWILSSGIQFIIRLYYLSHEESPEQERQRYIELAIEILRNYRGELLSLYAASLRNEDNNEGAAQEAIIDLPHIEAIEKGYCCICMSDIVESQLITKINCVHTFHSECIDTWLETRAVCPICKVKIPASII
ncbi:unnamed protein product [Blepharisma stoltei]|uniref:RING-type domain-containing protein n=1 Tax=Blepharisma stoltei TaxID=1481888 RepID=A0AAU9JAX4_9CILI|nr:unnamed protein product [Blepharisma stoltei]